MFEGGQMPLYRRIPKRGFTNAPFKTVYTPVNLYRLDCFKKGETVSEESLKEKGVISGKRNAVKILGKGDIGVALKVDVAAVSEKAKEKILAQGGEIVERKKN
jgi:large subunit ribosomal protein L15